MLGAAISIIAARPLTSGTGGAPLPRVTVGAVGVAATRALPEWAPVTVKAPAAVRSVVASWTVAEPVIASWTVAEAILARPPVISSRAPVIAPGPVVAARTVISARGPTPHTVRSRPPAGALSPGPLWATSSVWASALTAALGAIVAGIVGWTHRGSP